MCHVALAVAKMLVTGVVTQEEAYNDEQSGRPTAMGEDYLYFCMVTFA